MKKLIFISASLMLIMTSCNQKSKSDEFTLQVNNNTKNVLELVRNHKASIDSLTSINKLDSVSVSLINRRISKKMAKLIVDNAKLNSDIVDSNIDSKISHQLIDCVHDTGLLSSYYIEYDEFDFVANGINSCLFKK